MIVPSNPYSGSGTYALPFGWIHNPRGQNVGKGRYVGNPEHRSGLAGCHEIETTANVLCDSHGEAEQHRLVYNQAPGFKTGRQYKDVAGRVMRRKFSLVAKAGESHVRQRLFLDKGFQLSTERAIADEQQASTMASMAQFSICAQQIKRTLALNELARKTDDRVIRGKTKSSFQLRP